MSVTRKNTNVVELRRVNLPDIPHASVCSPGQRVNGSRNEVWLCPAYSGSYTVMLYVKPALKLRQVVAEIVVAQVGRAMGLPCPQPYVVSVSPKSVGRPQGKSMLAFGSEQAGHMGMATPIRSLSLMMECLEKTKHSHGTAVLDELVGNSVRGPGDVLFDPQGAVWLIDHEDALREDLAPDEAVTNWLAAQMLQRCDANARQSLLAALRAVATKARTLSLKHQPDALSPMKSGPETYQEVLDLVAQRLEELDRLLSQRILPEQGYLQLQSPHNISHVSQRPASI